MKVVGKISLGLTAALALQAASGAPPNAAMGRHPMFRPGAHGPKLAPAPAPGSPAPDALAPGSPDDFIPAFVLPPDNPYGSIVARNIFGLVPIPRPGPDTPPGPPPDPPPKITANGIMNVFGQLDALFKVSMPAKGKEPAKEQSYMLTQGQRQDDITVVKIDAIKAVITFDNHGETQEIPLVADAKGGGTGGGSGVGGPITGGVGGFAHPMPGAGGGFTGVGGPGANPNLARNNSSPGQNNSGGAPSGNPQIYQPEQSDMTPEQNAVLIEAQREAAMEAEQNGQKPAVPSQMFPPTSLTLPPRGGNETSESGGLSPN